MSNPSLFDNEPMPVGLAEKLAEARLNLRRVSDEVDIFLEGLFEQTWIACRRSAVQGPELRTRDFVKADGTVEKVPYSFSESPDFNEFDRKTKGFQTQLNGIRWLLWDIHKVAYGEGEK